LEGSGQLFSQARTSLKELWEPRPPSAAFITILVVQHDISLQASLFMANPALLAVGPEEWR